MGPVIDPVDWDGIVQALMSRSGEKCEIQSPDCLGAWYTTNSGITIRGLLHSLPRWKRSAHHRRPRGMGGTRRVDVHSLAALVNTCGDGVTGCHGYAERHRTWAYSRGLLVPNNGSGDAVDPAAVPLVLPSGRRVMLDPVVARYGDPDDGIMYAYLPDSA